MTQSVNPASGPLAPADHRLELVSQWCLELQGTHGIVTAGLRPASSDASFRRYFRIDSGDGRSFIVMDAPPPQEDCTPFVAAAAALRETGIRTPAILAADLARGILLLEDFGQTTMLQALERGDDPHALYADAMASLIVMQAGARAGVFPAYDAHLLRRELDLFPEWYVQRHLGQSLTQDERNDLERVFALLIASALAQPKTYVHRDYHSRNLMILAGGSGPGVLDFQDAVCGPITYDLVSLLRDAYVAWPRSQVLDWTVRFWQQARRVGLAVDADMGEFWRGFEWMGLQRHLKVLGIFARLKHRDGKDRYEEDMPRVLGYVLDAARHYEAMAPLVRLLERIHDTAQGVGYTF